MNSDQTLVAFTLRVRMGPGRAKAALVKNVRRNQAQHRWLRPRHALLSIALLLFAGMSLAAPSAAAADFSFADVVASVQPKLVKIFGAGGLQGLEAYQSGFLVSPNGHVLTTWSYVLDTDTGTVTVVLNDGRKFEAKVVGADPRLEIAVLQIDSKELPFFDLKQPVELEPGSRVLAFSNLFGVATGNEPASVQHGIVAAKTPLAAKRGAFETTFRGSAYVLDAMTNNPGAAGGALTDRRGQIAGLLGKELRNAQNNTWLNFALPVAELTSAVDDIIAGKTRPRSAAENTVKKPKEPVTLALLGIVLVPDVLAKTPPFIDRIELGSPAHMAGLRPDDLVLFVNDRVIGSCKLLFDELSFIDRLDSLRLTVQRGQELMEVTLQVPNSR